MTVILAVIFIIIPVVVAFFLRVLGGKPPKDIAVSHRAQKKFLKCCADAVRQAVLGKECLVHLDLPRFRRQARKSLIDGLVGLLNKRLIPVLVGGAKMPNVDQLPPAIARLARCQAHAIDDTRFAYDLDALIRFIERRPSLLNQFLQLANSERLRRWRQASTGGVALLMLFFGWVQLFDVFGIDARVESYTMALGDLVVSVPVSERIAIVGFDERTEARLGPPGPAWRSEHARLIDRLVEAGAKVIVFDLYFERTGADDAELIAAIERARQRGSQVFVGVGRLLEGRPVAIPGLGEAASSLGMLCIGGRIGYASVAPLAAVKAPAAGAAGSHAPVGDSGRFIAIAMLAAGAETLAVDERRRQLTVVSEQGQTLWQGPLKPIKVQVEASGELNNDCPLLLAGDRVAEMMIRVAPAGAWRDPLRRFDYQQVAGSTAGFRPGQLEGRIVLVGDARPGADEFRTLRGLRQEVRHGVELHADVVNNLIQGIQTRRLETTQQFLLMLLFAAAGGWLRVCRPGTSTLVRRLLLAPVLFAYLGVTVMVYASYGVLLNTAYHIGAFVLTYYLLGKLAAREGKLV